MDGVERRKNREGGGMQGRKGRMEGKKEEWRVEKEG